MESGLAFILKDLYLYNVIYLSQGLNSYMSGTIVYPNKIPLEQRIILHDGKALSLISFQESDPKKINDWVRRGNHPVLWDPRSWKLVEHTKWKIERDEEDSIEHVEACIL
jgi:hypothetical protein